MKPIFLLHLDTSDAECAVLLSADGVMIQQAVLEDSKMQAASINVLIESVIRKAGIEMQALSAICICNGPGSYTGLRVGLSTAKGLCFALDIPLITINKIDLIAATHSVNSKGIYAVLLKARTNEWFGGVYTQDETLESPKHVDENLLQQWIQTYSITIIYSDDIALETMEAFPPLKNIENNYFNTDIFINSSLSMFKDKNFADIAYVEPFYLKAPFTTQSKSDILRRNSKP